VKESCANANTNRYRAPLPRRSRSSFSNVEGRDFFPDGERWRNTDPARGEKKNCAPSRNLSQTESTHRRASIANHPNATSNPSKLHRRAKTPKTTLACDRYLPPIYARTHFFLDQKRPNKCRREGGKKFHPPETARARPNAKNAIARKPRDISLRCEPNGKKREERRESIRSSRRTIFVYLRFSFVFFFCV